MRRELLEKQKPIMDLYHNLSQLKSRLEELGRSVKLEEVKLVYFEDCNKKLNYNVTVSWYLLFINVRKCEWVNI